MKQDENIKYHNHAQTPPKTPRARNPLNDFMHTLCAHPPLNETPVRIILGLILVLFLPGYALIATLFPRKDDFDGVERIALIFGLSIAISPLLGLALNYTPFGIRLSPVLIVLSVFTVSLALCAYVRRYKIPEEDRFVVEIG
jgi:uncharacterized membrane protein